MQSLCTKKFVLEYCLCFVVTLLAKLEKITLCFFFSFFPIKFKQYFPIQLRVYC